ARVSVGLSGSGSNHAPQPRDHGLAARRRGPDAVRSARWLRDFDGQPPPAALAAPPVPRARNTGGAPPRDRRTARPGRPRRDTAWDNARIAGPRTHRDAHHAAFGAPTRARFTARCGSEERRV